MSGAAPGLATRRFRVESRDDALVLRVRFFDEAAMYRRGLAVIHATTAILALAPLLRIPPPEQHSPVIMIPLGGLVAAGVFLGAIGTAYAQRIAAFEGGVYETVRRTIEIVAHPADPAYREGAAGGPALRVDGREVPRARLRSVVVTRRVQYLTLYTVAAPDRFNVCLVLRDGVIRVETFDDVESARALAEALAGALDLDLESVAEIREPFAAAGGVFVPMVPLVVDMAMSVAACTFGAMRARDGAFPWTWTASVAALLALDWALQRWLVLGPARREAAEDARGAFGLRMEGPG